MRMTRTILVLAASLGTLSIAFGQVWEKFLMPGLTYRMEVDSGTPRIVHALRFSADSPWIQGRPELAQGVILADDPTRGRSTVSEMVSQTGAIAGINGDFFPFTGDPLGLMVREGELLSIPPGNRAAFAWGPSAIGMAVPSFRGSLSVGDIRSSIDGFNEECGPEKVVLNTDRVGLAKLKGAGKIVTLKIVSGVWTPSGSVEAEVVSVTSDSAIKVDPGNAALVASGARARIFDGLQVGLRIRMDWQTSGLDWGRLRNAIGGGPMLVQNGQILVDWAEEGFNEAFALKRHPRTAVGRTKAGDIWFVAIDGRQAASDGATLEETARIMLRLGCVDAMNLDGGGSTTFNLWGLTLNRPSDGKERPVANGVMFVRQEPEGSSGATVSQPIGVRIKAPEVLPVDQTAALKLIGPDGKPLRNSEAIWSASGDAWIDQGGMLHPIKLGSATVSVWFRGTLISAAVQIQPLAKGK